MVAAISPARPSTDTCHFADCSHCRVRLERFCLYSLKILALAGVLAFLFAVASPDDDLTQQEFVHTRKSAQVLLPGCKAVRSSANPVLSAVLPVYSALLCAPRKPICNSSSPSSVLRDSPVGQRSPPFLR
jgi:hypothetical protein